MSKDPKETNDKSKKSEEFNDSIKYSFFILTFVFLFSPDFLLFFIGCVKYVFE